MLVAVFMLFVVGGMAALSIDAVTIYTARSEAQLAADGAALAAARMLANSGMTSNAPGLTAAAETLASAVAIQVAQNSLVGGRYLVATNGEVTVSFSVGTTTNPKVTVRTQRTDLPTFFARIWGSTQITVAASATAEAYNPSGASTFVRHQRTTRRTHLRKAVAAAEHRPHKSSVDHFRHGWLHYQLKPVGMVERHPDEFRMRNRRNLLVGRTPAPVAWNYYPGDQSSFPAPTTALPTCSPARCLPLISKVLRVACSYRSHAIVRR